jgi:hypothetical protein
MIRAALITLALTAPASASTVNDLTMTLIDGRPVFRPADGLDCWTAKFGGIPIDCALADADLTRPRRAPCWIRPTLWVPALWAALCWPHSPPPPRLCCLSPLRTARDGPDGPGATALAAAATGPTTRRMSPPWRCRGPA